MCQRFLVQLLPPPPVILYKRGVLRGINFMEVCCVSKVFGTVPSHYNMHH